MERLAIDFGLIEVQARSLKYCYANIPDRDGSIGVASVGLAVGALFDRHRELHCRLETHTSKDVMGDVIFFKACGGAISSRNRIRQENRTILEMEIPKTQGLLK